ncbi:Wd40 repeat-containing protein, partial [Globisporangium splendens]
MAERTVVLWFGGGSGADDDDDDDESSSDEEYVPMQDTGGEEEADDDDNNEEQNEDEEEYDDDDDEGRGFWEPEDEDNELSSETEEFLRGVIEKALPEDVRTSIDRIFAGESYFPMLFARSEHELEQKKKIANERIAHQLRGYNSDFTERKNSESGSSSSSGTNMGLPSSSARHFPLHYHRTNKKRMFHTLCLREQVGLTSTAQSIKLQETFMPFQENKHCKVVDYVRDRLYCGGFNSTGSSFLAAGQRGEILLYDTVNWERSSSLPVRDVRWTVTDAKFTPDDQSVLYSSINSNVRMVSVNYEDDGKEDVFCLIKPPRGTRHSEMHRFTMGRFGVWCMDMNASGTEFVAGTSSNSVVLYDMQTKTPVCHVEGHRDDVNAIAFVDGPLHSNVFVSGSDDQLIKLWDRRVLSESNPRAQGVFPGHTDGLTHISSRDDGYYFISNSKDQSCKLWDIRRCMSSEAHDRTPPFRRPYRWDYRYQSYPGRNKLPVTHPDDMSVMTYRGHMIMETLIRCYFSPLHSTAQKYIYTGSADGRVYVYDSISGDLVEVFAMKPNGLTRDVRWHPFEPTIVSPDFYGKLCVWQRHE